MKINVLNILQQQREIMNKFLATLKRLMIYKNIYKWNKSKFPSRQKVSGRFKKLTLNSL